MANKFKIGILILHLIFGFYLINFFLDFIVMPEAINQINDILLAFSGILVVLGGINFLRTGKKSYSKE